MSGGYTGRCGGVVLAARQQVRTPRTLRVAAAAASVVVAATVVLAATGWAGRVVSYAVAVVLALAANAAVLALGRLRHRHVENGALLNESAEAIAALSVIPVISPNPIVKAAPAGTVLYANPAAEALLADLGCRQDLAMALRVDDLAWIAEVAGGTAAASRELSVNGRCFRASAARVPSEAAVLLTLVEITRLKELEAELRQANERLEHDVLVKTFDLMLTQDVTIMSLVALAETRDSETGAHIERTRRYVRALARQLARTGRYREELDDDAIHLLFRSAPLHDIGKVGIRDDVLLETGPLEPARYDRMKRHTILGGDALRWAEQRLGHNSFLQVARDIAYYHHEHWDGTGYPHGLSGEQIPLAARLMALADVYDALTSRRRYKQSLPHERARDEIVACRGTHFDPDVVDAFLACEEEFREIAVRYREENDTPEAREGRYLSDAEDKRLRSAVSEADGAD